jgi:hypothetical protein
MAGEESVAAETLGKEDGGLLCQFPTNGLAVEPLAWAETLGKEDGGLLCQFPTNRLTMGPLAWAEAEEQESFCILGSLWAGQEVFRRLAGSLAWAPPIHTLTCLCPTRLCLIREFLSHFARFVSLTRRQQGLQANIW